LDGGKAPDVLLQFWQYRAVDISKDKDLSDSWDLPELARFSVSQETVDAARLSPTPTFESAGTKFWLPLERSSQAGEEVARLSGLRRPSWEQAGAQSKKRKAVGWILKRKFGSH
jgi:hypothetical protein